MTHRALHPTPLGAAGRRQGARWTATTCVLALLAASVGATAAHATGGAIEYSSVTNCNVDPERGIMAGTESLDDPLPRVGDVFYVRTRVARVGNACGAHMSAHVELVLPPGVSTAISASSPVRCGHEDGDGGLIASEGCPQAGTPGIYGLAFDQVTSEGPRAWEMPYGRMQIIEVPVRSPRTLVGAASRLPSCNRVYGSPPCPGDMAGDHVQFATKVIDGFGAPWLAPYAPLIVGPASPASPAATGPTATPPAASGSSGIVVSVPRSIRTARLRRGVPIAVHVAQAGSRVSARLTLRGRTVAQATVPSAPAGTRSLRLRSTASGRRWLRLLSAPASATLHVTVQPPAASAVTAQKQVKLRR